MIQAYAVPDIRRAEAALLSSLADGALMQRAAWALAARAVAMLGFGYGARVLLLVGSGDNGGDALYAGVELARRGVSVTAVLADADRVHATALEALRGAGGRTTTLADAASAPADLVIDGLLGIGASGPVREAMLPLVELANRHPAPVLAVDVPSGVDAGTGAVANVCVRAEVTLCMGALKPGLLVGPGRQAAGQVAVVDLGLGPQLPPRGALEQLTADDVVALLPEPGPDDDKYTRGVVGIAAGSEQYPGAARLAVGAARRGGVGAVRYAGHAATAVSDYYPDVLVGDTVTTAGRVQAWAVGPGLGSDTQAHASLEAVMAANVPVLVDADGLNLLAGDRHLLDRRSAPTVLTPHDREFERLFGEVGADRLAAARRASAESGAVVLLKGYSTVVAEPDGRCRVNPTGHPALATAGSGDVLSGLVGSLLAGGLEPALAAAVGAYLHGAAGARAARSGPVSATDLVEVLPQVIADLGPSTPARRRASRRV